mmetsp:Transcript_9242/g.27733  ORF Transcript_9242/g.27733 Transcript_9242/m.27733 type:complete len:1604 (+) Transcript_9242:484-5295(+)
MGTFLRTDGAVPVLADWDLHGGHPSNIDDQHANTQNANGYDPEQEAEQDDFEALRAAALEQLPMELRSRRAILPKGGEGKVHDVEVADVRKLTPAQRRVVVDRALAARDQDTERFLRRLKERMDRVGIKPTTVEVRFEHLTVKADVYVGSRSMPTLINEPLNMAANFLTKLGLLKTSKQEMIILDDVSGVLKPGRLTLLLGPPSAGKSTLLKALAGKLRGVQETGRVTFNGEDLHGGSFVPARTAAYIEQTDQHVGELTVRETMDFAARCLGVGHKEQELNELRKREKEQGVEPDWEINAFLRAEALVGKRSNIATEYVLRLLGLDICADTLVGNEMMRGVSGGQKKRVTTGELIVGPMKTLFMDEISTGLDSSTTFQIVKSLRDFVHLREGTILCALLQPPPEVFDLFDDVILLAEGVVVYHGPIGEVTAFFASQGFQIPERKAVADFMQEVTSRKDQKQYWNRPDEQWRFVPVATLAEAFKSSKRGRANEALLEQPFDNTGNSAKDPLVRTNFALGPWKVLKAMLRRDWILMERNRFLYVFRFMQMLILAFVTATLFPKPRQTYDTVAGGSLLIGAIFFSLLQFLFDGMTEMVLTIDRLPIYYKQTDNKFFPSWSFVFPTTIMRLPYSIAQGILWAVIVYWSIGLAPEASRFFIFVVILVVMHQLGVAMFRAFGALCRSETVANTFGSFFFLTIMILGGFVLAKPDIKIWWQWGYWVSPMSYAQNAITVNEFKADRWKIPSSDGRTVGENVLIARGLPTDDKWVGLGIGALVAWACLFNLLTWIFHALLGPVGQAQGMVSEDNLQDRDLTKLGSHTTPSGITVSAHEPTEVPVTMHSSRNTLAASARRMSAAAEAGESPHGSYRSLGRSASLEQPGIQPATLSLRNMAKSMGRSSPINQDGNNQGGDYQGGDYQDQNENQNSAQTASNSLRMGSAGVPIARRVMANRFGESRKNMGQMEQGAPIDGGGEEEFITKGMVLPFTPLALTFKDMHYYVALPKSTDTSDPDKLGPKVSTPPGQSKPMLELLRGISGTFCPGILTALVGVSGAGKTTLMDVLAGRKTGGLITGDIRVDGHPKNQETFARVAGYCEQLDVHAPAATVGEALLFSGRLRFGPEVDDATVNAFVVEVMDLVELHNVRDALVGKPGVSGLSVEARKRLTIAVELVANPSIVFMDEPTSGLDARAAAIVMRAVRNTVNTGRTVVCTIHQPSIEIFESFDELLLLKRGGEVIYMGPLGPLSADLIAYFQSIKGVTPIREGINPATWVLEVTMPGAEARLKVDFAEQFRASEVCRCNERLIAELSVPREGSEPLSFATVYSQGRWSQFTTLLHRNFRTYWRSPPYNGVRFFSSTIIGLLLGSVFWQIGTKTDREQDIFNLLGSLYVAVLFIGIINSMTVQPVVGAERPVFFREQAAGMYSVMPFALAQIVVEFPYNFLQVSIYALITFFMIGFEITFVKFAEYWLVFFLTLNLFTIYGLMAVSLTPNVPVANVLSSTFYGLWNLTAGFIIPAGSIPGWWIWMYYINPVSWSLYGVIVTQLGDFKDRRIQKIDGTFTTVPQYLEDSFQYKYSFRGWVYLILIGFSILFAAVSAIAQKKINFQNR